MTTWLNENIIGIHDIATKRPKYSKGSVALLSFNNPSSLWKVLKNPPILKHGESRIWLTIPKTIEARARASALSAMRKALGEHKPIDSNISILYTTPIATSSVATTSSVASIHWTMATSSSASSSCHWLASRPLAGTS